ncbi:MAG: N-acetylmuramoyl-L-alanine amidase [Spirochaetaceae bacterium]|nr:MAG: N-acetylmuramoyl-L-alanine amidase [Spirochaetaceae bacterium]
MAQQRTSRVLIDKLFVLFLFTGIALPLGLPLYGSLESHVGFLRHTAAADKTVEELLTPQPAQLAAVPLYPWRVGIQAGHWKIDELPEELRRLRASTGARYGNYLEVDANLDVARRVVQYLLAAGIQVDLFPATVPPGYQADAFVAVHADGAYRAGVRGWKIATPWRSSEASRLLRDALVQTYPQFTGLPEDRYGTTYNMRGYYAFSPHRFRHAIAGTTPAIIIETGFVTVAEDREVLFGAPDTVARGIAAGIIRYLSRRDPLDLSAVVVRRYPVMRVAGRQAELTFHPEEGAKVAGRLEEGTLVRPVHQENGWVEVIVWGNYRRFGWMRQTDLEIVGGSS